MLARYEASGSNVILFPLGRALQTGQLGCEQESVDQRGVAFLGVQGMKVNRLSEIPFLLSSAILLEIGPRLNVHLQSSSSPSRSLFMLLKNSHMHLLVVLRISFRVLPSSFSEPPKHNILLLRETLEKVVHRPIVGLTYAPPHV